MLICQSANQQLLLSTSIRRAGLEVLGEREVSWKLEESRHEAHQEVTGASVIEVLLTRDEQR